MKNDIIIYMSDDGTVKLDVNIENETVWLSIEQMSKLFDRDKSVISRHIKNIFDEKELQENSCVAFFATQLYKKDPRTNKNRLTIVDIKHFNLDVIISVGYRIKSVRGTQFRIWANNILKQYMIKGFAIDEEKLKNNGDSPYFEELLYKIRDIRSSEKVFWRKVLDIFSTSIDYDPKTDTCKNFFRTIQNKMHWATHGHTAAELIFTRVDSNKKHLGLFAFKGEEPTKYEVGIAKNYLNSEELNMLNRMVSAYLDIAEINALSRKTMKMSDWIEELESFLTMTRKDILKGNGVVSHKEALKKAHEEYDKYMMKMLTKAEKDYLTLLEKDIKDLEDK